VEEEERIKRNDWAERVKGKEAQILEFLGGQEWV